MIARATLRQLSAALFLTLGLPGAVLAQAGDTASAAQNLAALRVVILEQLMMPLPKGHKDLAPAVQELEQEFAPQIARMQALEGEVRAELNTVALAEEAGKDDLAARNRAQTLSRRLADMQEEVGRLFTSRQSAKYNPVIQEIDRELQRYAATTGTGEVFLITAGELNAQPQTPLLDVTGQFVAWANAQP
ncbi:MAG: hypothetical protein EOO80_22865 [Oxalobacteraceae bacterium]|nr:MAG: hypothetical protein EOO80_22865 [Oxalobacteraceae bacterium]